VLFIATHPFLGAIQPILRREATTYAGILMRHLLRIAAGGIWCSMIAYVCPTAHNQALHPCDSI
jgi:hypothetical protein